MLIVSWLVIGVELRGHYIISSNGQPAGPKRASVSILRPRSALSCRLVAIADFSRASSAYIHVCLRHYYFDFH